MPSQPLPVFIPLLNSNEPEVRLASLAVEEGQRVNKGDVLGIIETTKSTADLTAEVDGFVVGLIAKAGQSLRAGETLCYLAGSKDWIPSEAQSPSTSIIETSRAQSMLPEGLRITQPALSLALEKGLDFSSLPIGPLVTENLVRELLRKTAQIEIPERAFDPKAIIVYGGGGHGKSLIDLIRAQDVYAIAGIVDDGMAKASQIMGLPVLGGKEALDNIYAQGIHLAVNAVGGIGDIPSRIAVFQRLEQAGFVCPTLAHPSAVIEASTHLSAGVQVMPQAYVGSEARVGFGAIVNTGAVVSHDCALGDYTNVSPGALLAGEVQVGKSVLIGMGATINLGVKIGAGARIGNSATVKADVPEGSIVRAGTIWPA